jgi:carbamoyl-phosphate synthase large subunit
MFNILLSSAGRQSFLVKEFRDALDGRGSVFASDFNMASTSLKAADKGFVTPAYTDSEYVNCIVELCKLHSVSLLIS